MWLLGYWLTGYWPNLWWNSPPSTIRYGMGIRLGAGWKLGSDPLSNPLEYFPYFRQIPDASTPTFGVTGFGGGHFGLGQFGEGEFSIAPTFVPESAFTPIYS